jgi:hypothetical protein
MEPGAQLVAAQLEQDRRVERGTDTPQHAGRHKLCVLSYNIQILVHS